MSELHRWRACVHVAVRRAEQGVDLYTRDFEEFFISFVVGVEISS